MNRIRVSTVESTEICDITSSVKEQIPADSNGHLTVFSQHTTAGITVQEAEEGLVNDLATALEELIRSGDWAHDEIDNNAASHLRASLIGPSVTIPVVDGDLQLGTWQSILLVECDGPRTRTLTVTTD